MLIETLQSLFYRDLQKLRDEIELYTREENIWKVDGNIANSSGNLCLHLVGNLNTYIGKEIGKTDYIRNRKAEFSVKNISRIKLLSEIDDTINVVHQALGNLNESDLANQFPALVFDVPTSIEYMLLHLVTHLAYHLGQINYHRRLMDK